MQKTLPDLSPLLAPDLICHTCAEKIIGKVVTTPRGNVLHVRYEHRNEKTGCSYWFTQNTMVQAELKALRPDESEAKL